MVAGCGKKQPANTNTPAKKAEESALEDKKRPANTSATTSIKTATPALEDKVAGEYHALGDPSKKVALRAGGIMHSSEDGKPNEDEEGTWSVKNGEVYISVDEGIVIFEIKGDGNLQIIARLKNDGVREDAPEDMRKNFILKKVK